MINFKKEALRQCITVTEKIIPWKKELGYWENPIVKLRQPFLESPTYWQSESITISLSNLLEKDDTMYRFAIHVPKKSEKFIFEGNDEKDNRILDIGRNNQFAIWKNNVIYLNDIQDYAFVDYIFNSIGSYNLKDKVTEYQYLLSLHDELTVNVSNIEFINNHIDDKLREKQICNSGDVDPGYTFVNRLKALKYHDDDLLATFIKEAEMISPYIKNIEFDIYINLAKWLIQLCHNNDSLFKLWNDILFHNSAIDESILKSLIDQIQKNISYDNAVNLENHFKRSADPNITAIRVLIQNDNLNWNREDIIQLLELVSQSCNLELLTLFPEILDNWFRRDFSDTKEKKMPNISKNWFTFLLNKLDSNNTNKSIFIFSVFQHLERMHPLLGHRKNIWENLTIITIDRVKGYSESQIIGAIKFIAQIKEQKVKELFLELVKEILNKVIQEIDPLINRIFLICNCEGKMLKIPNAMCEDILCYIMTRLQHYLSDQHINIMNSRKLWVIILNATRNVGKLRANAYIQRIKTSITELNRLLLEKRVNMRLLQLLLEYSDEQIFQYFEETIGKNKSMDDVIISQEEIAELRKYFQLEIEMFIKFLDKFYSSVQVIDRNDFIRNMQNSELKQLMVSNHWKNMFDSVRRCYKYYQSQIFQNVFENCIRDDSAATKVEYIIQKLAPTSIEKYNMIYKQFEEWEKLKCSDVSLLWKNAKNVDTELDLIDAYKNKNQKFVQALDNLLGIPQWIEQLINLENVVKNFGVSHNEDDWLSLSIRILKDDTMELGQINNFFDYLDRNLSCVNQDCWKLIKELSNSSEFVGFLKKIFECDIRNLINCEYYSDERLIQEVTISSLIQIKQYLFPLMNKNMETINDFLAEILKL
ncbi:hypothetical protein C1646_752088 [Rhizophagus diaphanus]|nr:hypothetical protein C1646_752088 [Rhizophagus diaphanus] [Rhizophagus sp. MUCL 43196]